MATIIPLSTYKDQRTIHDGFDRWRSLFDEPLGADTRLSDLQPGTLCYLSETCDESTSALHALVIGFSGYGAQTSFDALDSSCQSRILDIFLFLSDQIRFEMMFRLEWLEYFSGNRFPLFDMVKEFDRIKNYCQDHLPALATDHADYDTYRPLYERDQQVFIRRLFMDAQDAFKKFHQLT